MPPARCPECGDTKPLVDGRCAWRHGCEHRQLVAEARAHDLERELAAILSPAPTVQGWQQRAWELAREDPFGGWLWGTE